MYTMNEMNKEIMALLTAYEITEGRNYYPTEYGVNQMLSVWMENKKDLIEAMSKHPNYNGRFQIVLDETFQREIDHDAIYRFARFIDDEVKRQHLTDDGSVIIEELNDGKEYKVLETLTNYYRVEEIFSLVPKISCRHIPSKEGKPSFEDLMPLLDFISAYHKQYLDDEDVDRINRCYPWAKIHRGAKTSRTIQRICKHFGIDKLNGFNSAYTKYADAINPLDVTRWTIISVNPVDYLTMSFGNSWASCHTIDKTNIRDMPNNYEGMYSCGTLSYMLDGVSVVVYVVDKAFNGKEFELEPKINRQMFHIGAEKIIQGRLYPQDNDCGSEELYKKLREIVQHVFSTCFEWDNLWTNRKGTDACAEVINSAGTHYKDYLYYSNCNVSYLKRETDHKNMERITVGNFGICPECGAEHYTQDCIVCGSCYSETETCKNCGAVVGEGDGYTYDDYHFCCAECAEDCGFVLCDDGDIHPMDNDDVIYDNYLEQWCYDSYGYWRNAIHVDDCAFISEENANRYGYYRCVSCGEWYCEDDYDFEMDMCIDCARAEKGGEEE